MKTALETAQEILSLIAEDRPQYLNKRVVSLTVSPHHPPLKQSISRLLGWVVAGGSD